MDQLNSAGLRLARPCVELRIGVSISLSSAVKSHGCDSNDFSVEVFMKIRFCIAKLALIESILVIRLWSQPVSTAQISGTVQDSTGSAVSGAQVRATQTDTGVIRTAVSGTDGLYVLPNLPVGPYTLEVTKEGFSKFTQSGIVLQVATNPTIPVTLQVGAVNAQVQVEANAAMVETQSTGVGTVIESKRIVDLPLIGRQVTDLITLSGAADQRQRSRYSFATQLSFRS
jgi:hypothetical protein